MNFYCYAIATSDSGSGNSGGSGTGSGGTTPSNPTVESPVSQPTSTTTANGSENQNPGGAISPTGTTASVSPVATRQALDIQSGGNSTLLDSDVVNGSDVSDII
jgi:hypothetical protein